jgi:hypothetical protein
MPAVLIVDQDGMSAGIDGCGDFCEMGVHRLGVAPGQNEADAFALFRTDCAKDIGSFGALIVRRAGPCSTPGPAACDLSLLADAGAVLEPHLDLYAGPRRSRIASISAGKFF